MEAPPILAFDTAGPWCTAALLRAGRLLGLREEAMPAGQAERLMPMLAQMLAEAGTAWGDLGLVAAGTGPGSFTGQRIAVAAARGLALALGVPAVGVTGLEAAAFGLPRPLVAALDLGRGQVALARFDAADPAAAATAGPVAADPAAPPDWALGLPAAGSGAALISGARALAPAAPLAEAIARIAAARAAGPQPQPRPAPLYLRPPDAAPAAPAPPLKPAGPPS